jgi:hypothetical protein
MQRLRDILEIILLVCFIGFILVLAFFAIHGAHKIKALGDEASSTLENLNRTVVIAANAFTNVEKASREWKDNSQSQASQTTAVLGSAQKTIASLQRLVDNTDAQLNGSVLPSLATAVNEQSRTLMETQRNLQSNLAELGQATAQLNKTLEDGDALIADQNIKEALAKLATASQNAADATGHLSAIAADGQQVADKFRNDYLKPQKFAWELLKQLAGLGGSTAQMIK